MNPQLLGIASEMALAGLPERFIDAAVALAEHDQGARLMLRIWHDNAHPFDRAAARERLSRMVGADGRLR